MNTKLFSLALGAMALSLAACSGGNNSSQNDGGENAGKQEVYEAQIQPLNANITGLETDGVARFVIANDTMTVTIDINNAPPGIEHWQHFHGFTNDDSVAVCATAAQDANGDGIVDVVETEPVSGTTMVPFNKLPAAMDVGSNTYPVADSEGAYHYEAKIPMNDLNKAFADAFGGAVQLDHRVLYIHGVPKDVPLPESVASIGDIPAQVTLPIACGKIHKVE